jgi:hypothetical protein
VALTYEIASGYRNILFNLQNTQIEEIARTNTGIFHVYHVAPPPRLVTPAPEHPLFTLGKGHTQESVYL